ncbi:allantoate deiminase [Tindallia magadiensis]|uniref:Allantoate deiminase n=1 Tax=Tindallia magadiensis TaxID=69895 RepID=A0A1I3H1H3_9FIRM|nr:allantoate deiminase [Tindallia magadiensis]SFI29531.1 allantoate deiminase [Tindallia magadiensis]
MKSKMLKQDIMKAIHELSQFGQDECGGMTRLLYDEAWVKAQNHMKKMMEEGGLDTSYDAVGNLFGRLEGTAHKDQTILIGSHIDTVKNGGMYDGQFGIVAGLIAASYLKRNFGQPLRNIEIVSISEEEGSRFPLAFWGTKNLLGLVGREEVLNVYDENGVAFAEAMHQAGFDFRPEDEPLRQDILAFLEIHIEQGCVLEKERKPLGIVSNIVGQRRFSVELTGESNHAGTTPMGYRRDAVHAATEMISNILNRGQSYGDPLVVTVGKIDVKPNVVNVVPGQLEFSIDTRHPDKKMLEDFTKEIHQLVEETAEKHGLKFCLDMWMDTDPVPMDEGLTQIIEAECVLNGVDFLKMNSGAGHDAQLMANHVPTALIFVPSHRGISHSPHEHTDGRDLALGVHTLIKTLYQLAYKEETGIVESIA